MSHDKDDNIYNRNNKLWSRIEAKFAESNKSDKDD